MLAIWPLGGLVYGVSRKENRLIRSVSLVGIVLCIIVALTAFYAAIWSAKEIRQFTAKAEEKISQIDWTGATNIQKAEMEWSFNKFHHEVNSKRLYLNLRVDLDLARLIRIYLKDNKLSGEEINDWVGNFTHRNDLDLNRFRKHLEQVRADSAG